MAVRKTVRVAGVGLDSLLTAHDLPDHVLIAILKSARRSRSIFALLAIALKQPNGLCCQEGEDRPAPPPRFQYGYEHAFR